MNDYIEERTILFARYIIENRATVRQTAKKYNISKSTVHKDVAYRLEKINPTLYKIVREILDNNRETRHIRGGIATREKYLSIKEKKGQYKRDYD